MHHICAPYVLVEPCVEAFTDKLLLCVPNAEPSASRRRRADPELLRAAMAKSEYEKQRDATIAQNHARLQSLGLEPVVPRAQPRPKAVERGPARARDKPESTRASKRARAAPPSYTGEHIDRFGDDEPRLRRQLLASDTDGASSSTAEPAPKPKRARAPGPSSASSSLVDGVRAYIEEHVPPELFAVEERAMFGCAMFLVRGNMFLGVAMRSERLLARMGEELCAPVRPRAAVL
jgi:hypothetical protein